MICFEMGACLLEVTLGANLYSRLNFCLAKIFKGL